MRLQGDAVGMEVDGQALEAREEADVHGAPQVGAAPQFNDAVGVSEDAVGMPVADVPDDQRRGGVGDGCLFVRGRWRG